MRLASKHTPAISGGECAERLEKVSQLDGASCREPSARAILDCLRRFVEILGRKARSGLVTRHELGAFLRGDHVVDILERAAAALVHHV